AAIALALATFTVPPDNGRRTSRVRAQPSSRSAGSDSASRSGDARDAAGDSRGRVVHEEHPGRRDSLRTRRADRDERSVGDGQGERGRSRSPRGAASYLHSGGAAQAAPLNVISGACPHFGSDDFVPENRAESTLVVRALARHDRAVVPRRTRELISSL